MSVVIAAAPMDETITIEVFRDDWKRVNRFKEPGDSMKDALQRALDALEMHQTDPAGVAYDDTPALARAEEAASDEGQTALEDAAQDVESDDGPAEDTQGLSDDDAGQGAFDNVEQLVGEEEPPEEAKENVGWSAWEIDVPGDGETEQKRWEALATAIRQIHERGEVKASQLRAHVFARFDGAGYESERSMWKNFLQPALGESEEVELADVHGGLWRRA